MYTGAVLWKTSNIRTHNLYFMCLVTCNQCNQCSSGAVDHCALPHVDLVDVTKLRVVGKSMERYCMTVDKLTSTYISAA